MAFAVESATGQTRTGTNAALSFTVTSANLLLVAISVGDDSPNPSSTLAGVALARGAQSFTAVASSAVDDGVFTGVKWFRLDDPTAGTTNITSTGLDAAAQASVHAVSFTGANLTLGTPSTATGSAANPSLTVAASASGDIVVAALCTDNASADTVAANTSIFDGEDVGADTDHNSQYKTASGANTVMAWTNADSGSGWSVSGLAVSPAASSREQEGFRWGVDDNNEASHGFEAAQDTDITILDDQSRLLRALVNATGDPATAAYTLRVQKNGSGGYSAVAVGATTTTSPPTAPTATVTTIGTAADPWTINRPAASTGDLIVFVLAWDDSVDVTSVAAPAGVNSETAVSIAGPIASNSTEMREQAWYYIATGAWTTGTLSFNPSATETVRAVAFVIPAAQFNAADPIGFANTRASAGIAETSVLSPTGTAEGNDGSGRLYIAFGSDTDALTAPGSNWNTINNATGGGVGLLVGSRNTLVSNSESITALTATIAGDSWATLCFVVKPKVVANEVYVVASANIAAGGEATTARLTAPAGKSTSDFVTGRRWDDENGTDSIDITTDDYTELEWLVYIASSAVNGDFYDFRVYAAAAALDSYTVTPRWTIGTSGGRTVNAATEALTLTRQNASIARSRALSAATEALTLTRHNATVARSRGIAAATEALTLTAQPSSIGRARGVVAATEALVLVGFAATVTFETTNDREVGATTELLTLTGQAATITTGRGVLASAVPLTLISFLATVQRGEVVTTVISRTLQSTRYIPSKSPLNTDPVLRSYTEREFQAVARALPAAYAPGDVRLYGAVGDGTTDDTAALQAAAVSGRNVFVPLGTYKITDEIEPQSNQTWLIEGTIRQDGTDKNIFRVDTKSNVWIDLTHGGLLQGEGSWSNSWVGNSGHEDRGIQFIECSNSGVLGGRIIDCGHAGVAIIGGSVLVDGTKIEGTHTHSTPINSSGNFQMGVFVQDNPTNGPIGIVCIRNIDISGTAQGIVREVYQTVDTTNSMLEIDGHIHDIPGQHGTYIQAGNLRMEISVTNTELSACKIQMADANTDSGSFLVNIVGENVGSHLFEIAETDSGSLNNLQLTGTGKTIGGCGLSILGKIRTLHADITVETLGQNAVLIQGADAADLDIKVTATDCTEDGVLVTATNATGIKLRPTLRNCNVGSDALSCGIRVNSVSANVDIFDPDVTDANTEMIYGLFNETPGSIIRVFGSAIFTGYAAGMIRANGIITEWPENSILDSSVVGLNQISSSGPMLVANQSVAASNVTLWQQTLDDESAYLVTAEIVGKLSTSAERRVLKITGAFYRDAGGVVTIQGAVDVDVDIASGGFAGAYSLASNGGSEVVLQVNSGGATTYDWKVCVTALKVA